MALNLAQKMICAASVKSKINYPVTTCDEREFFSNQVEHANLYGLMRADRRSFVRVVS